MGRIVDEQIRFRLSNRGRQASLREIGSVAFAATTTLTALHSLGSIGLAKGRAT